MNLLGVVFPAACCVSYIDERIDKVLRDVYLEIEKRYEVHFLEMGTDKDHVHFMVQSVSMYSVKKIVQMIKRITARDIFRECLKLRSSYETMSLVVMDILPAQ